MLLNEQIYEKIKSNVLNAQPCVLVSIVDTKGSSPRKRGACMLISSNWDVLGTVGGGSLELYSIKTAKSIFGSKKSVIKEFSLDEDNKEFSMICGGWVSLSFSYIHDDASFEDAKKFLFFKKTNLYIVGGGTVAHELCFLSSYVGFDTIVLDDRKEYASSNQHPSAVKCIHVKSYKELDKYIDLKRDDFFVSMTHGHSGDLDAVLFATKQKPLYIGCIGSRNKRNALDEFLRNNSVSEDVIKSIHSPIGLNIKAETPKEIAVSVLSEIILIYRNNFEI